MASSCAAHLAALLLALGAPPCGAAPTAGPSSFAAALQGGAVGAAACETDLDCSLNGVCTSGACACTKVSTTLSDYTTNEVQL